MGVRETNFWNWLAGFVPSKLAYFCFIYVTAIATTGKYDNTIVPDLTCIDALNRFAEVKGLSL